MKYDIGQLTIDEKLKLLSGRTCWQTYDAEGKLPEVFLSDGPNGLRMIDKKTISAKTQETIKATAMPNISFIANTWNVDMAYLDAQTIADDCIENDADVLLGPGVNIKRTPLCGRNFEYFSEDPLLAGTLAKAYIEGLQDKGIGASLKHFCANNREYDRLFISSEVDERTLREIYMPAFEIAIQAQPWTIMCSYNPVNGVYASENAWLLKDILRDEFCFNGVIVSDWEAVHQSARAAKAGLDLEMPNRAKAYEELKEAYESGWLTIEEIDTHVQRILELIEKSKAAKKEITFTKEQRHENAVKIAREGIVLLKNEDNLLPLKKGNILVGGAGYEKPPFGGGGSAYVETDYPVRSLDKELAERLGENANVFTSPRTYFLHLEFLFNANKLLELASEADTVVYCVGTNQDIERESIDRTHIRLNATQENFLLKLLEVNQNVVVVVETGSAIDMSKWIDRVKSVVYLSYAGEGGQEALADVLTGKICPSGKLNETFPLSLDDAPVKNYEGNLFVDRYPEGVFVGYRYYDTFNKNVLFPFGHGISYAQFEYSDLRIQKITETDYDVSFDVKNVSSIAAKEVPQIYVRDVFASVSRPQKELRAFDKIALAPGETKRVSVKLNARAFAFYSVPLKKWYVENGMFEILVGSSSRDIRLRQKIQIEQPKEEQTTFPS